MKGGGKVEFIKSWVMRSIKEGEKKWERGRRW
jgi:hypothetical protein